MFHKYVAGMVLVLLMNPWVSAQTWTQSFDHPVLIFGNGIRQTDDGGSLIVAETTNGFFQTSVAMRLDPEGQVVWQRFYDDFQSPRFLDVERMSSGNYLAVGQTAGRPWVIEIDGETGLRIHDFHPTTSFGSLTSIAATPDGGLILGGDVHLTSVADLYLIKLDQNLSLQWQRAYDLGGSDFTGSVVATMDGGYAIGGQTTASGSIDATAAKVDSAGQLQWARTYGTSGGDALFNSSLAQTSDGDLVLVSGQEDIVVLSLNETNGNIQWQKALGDASLDEEAASVVAPLSGGVVVAGHRGGEAWLVALDGSGSVQWQRQYGGTSGDSFRHVAPTNGGGFLSLGLTSSFGASFGLYAVRSDSQGRVVGCAEMVDTNAGSTPAGWATSAVAAVESAVAFDGTPTSPTSGEEALVRHPACAFCPVRFETFGEGLSGSGGFVPSASGTDGSCTGDGRAIHLNEALGGASAHLWIGLAEGEVPAFGGRLYLDFSAPWLLVPIVLSGPAGVPGAGSWSRLGTSDLSDLLGVSIVLQFTVLDAGAPRGLAMSNAMRLVIGDS